MVNLRELNPYERHKVIINDYVLNRPGQAKLIFERDTSKDRRDIDVIRENHKFLWDVDAIDESSLTWEEELAKQYYDRLFKEYCICDLSKYEENKVALRWRTQKEVIDGKGQFICGTKLCINKDKLRTWEVNFGYMEHGEKKNALVKLRLCTGCSSKLNFRSQKREIKRMHKQLSKKKKHKKNKQKKIKHKKRKSDKILDNKNLDLKESDESENDEKSMNDESPKTSSDDDINNDVWKSNEQTKAEPTRDKEFEKYLQDLIF